MKVGIIAPIKFLSKYCLCPTQYCLPSLLVDNKEYRAFYLRRTEMGDTIILDCRKVGWKREPEDFRIIEEALKALHPSLIVAPSYMFNHKDSMDVYKEFCEKFSSLNCKITKCWEGSSLQDVGSPFGTLAVPSHMYRYIGNLTFNPQTIFIENHLNIEELEGREGFLVTSLPVRLGLQGRLLSDYKPSPNSITFYEGKDNYPKVVMKNIRDTLEFYEEVNNGN